MPDSEHTEKPTQRRLDRARREGNFPSSREFISSVQFLGFVTVVTWFGGAFLVRLAHVMRELFARAFTLHLTSQVMVTLMRDVMLPLFLPLIVAGAALIVLVICAQLATTRMGISLNKLMPDLNRLNMLTRISNLPAQNIPMFLQALALLPVVGLVVYYLVSENLMAFLSLSWMGAQVAAARVASTLQTLLWRAAGLFLIFGFIDLAWQRHRYTNQLMMSKQELRDESKETNGNPQMKMRIRRLQRALRRRQMMKDVAKATAVIVNPTHYAVAIKYSVEAAGAPKVVAKGRNYLALRIRKTAIESQVPIIENAPLAQALYKSVEVGQEIPSHLYRAVAEILAYIYRLMGGRLP
jgi:flagellar biosynthesis protein FlhB